MKEIELRMKELEHIRKQMRKHLDAMAFNKRRSDFSIDFDAKILLTKGEELMMRKQIMVYRRDVFAVDVRFSSRRRLRKPSVTHIEVSAERKRTPLHI